MAQIVISPTPEIFENGAGEFRISNSIKWGDSKTWELEFSFEFDCEILPFTCDADPWLVLSLLPAMRAEMDLEVTRPVSPKLLQNLPTIQSIINSWDSAYKKIKVTAPARVAPAANIPGKTLCFFSGGVDSFYTILKHLDEIDLLVHLENPWATPHGREKMNEKIKEAARRLGKPLILVRSNFRTFLDTYTDWEYSHGAAFMTLAFLLSPNIGKVYLASDYTYASLEPAGISPLLDHLWGTEQMQVLHDGLEANRLQKIETMADNEIMLSCLRVCWTNMENELNCGRCRKCLYTMVSLRTAGVLDRCPAFAVPLDLEYLANFKFVTISSRWCLLENLEELERRQHDPALETAVRKALAHQTIPRELQKLAWTELEILELRQKVAYYEQGTQSLRYQLADKFNTLLSKNRLIYRIGETLAHRVWKFLK